MPGKLSTHVLDLTLGRPAAGMEIELWHQAKAGAAREMLQSLKTNSDGRTDAPLLTGDALKPGTYELVFNVRDYFAARGVACDFLQQVPIRFVVTDAGANYHVPLLVTPWAYSTYRGS